MTTEYNLEDNEGFNVDDTEIEISREEAVEQEKSDAIPPGKAVLFHIRKALIRKQLVDNKKSEAPDNPCMVTKVVLHCQVGPGGVDSANTGAGRMVFPEFPVSFDLELLKEQAKKNGYQFNEQTWKKEKRYPWIELMCALGQFDPKDSTSKPPKINESFLLWLYTSNEGQGQAFLADVLKRAIRVKSGNEWVDSGDFKNELKNFKAVPVAPADEDEETY